MKKTLSVLSRVWIIGNYMLKRGIWVSYLCKPGLKIVYLIFAWLIGDWMHQLLVFDVSFGVKMVAGKIIYLIFVWLIGDWKVRKRCDRSIDVSSKVIASLSRSLITSQIIDYVLTCISLKRLLSFNYVQVTEHPIIATFNRTYYFKFVTCINCS